MQSAMASTLALNVIILDFIELLNQVAKKTQDDCGRRFRCCARNFDADDGDPTRPVTTSYLCFLFIRKSKNYSFWFVAA